MIFHCTEKMRKKLHLPPLTQVADETGPHLRWYANVFTAQRVQYVLTTNAASLLSVVLPGRGLTDGAAYQRAFLESLGTYLGELEQRLVFERVILPGSATVVYSKTANRSVLGTMKEMAFECAYGLEYQGMDVCDVTRRLDETPYKAKKYKYPREAFPVFRCGKESRETRIENCSTGFVNGPKRPVAVRVLAAQSTWWAALLPFLPRLCLFAPKGLDSLSNRAHGLRFRPGT